MNDIDNKKSANVLMGYAEGMNGYLRNSGLGITEFGKRAIMNPSREAVAGLVKSFADRAFQGTITSAAENAGVATNGAKNAKIQLDVANSLKKEYTARAESVLLETQSSGGVMSNITTHQQLYMVALVQGVVQSTYNKIFKTVVDPNPIFVRQIQVPRFLDYKGKSHFLADVVNDNDLILELTAGAAANVVFDLDFDANKDINKNIIDAFNDATGSGQKIGGPRNYLNRGFKIVSVEYNNGTAETIPVDYTSMENHNQSGEVSDIVGVVSLRLTPKSDTDKEINIFGRIAANGDVKLSADSDKVKKIRIAFNLPPVGMQNPFTVQHRIAKYSETINEYVKAQCTLNELFQDDHQFYLGKDAIELFNTDVLTITNAKKDSYALKEVDSLIESLKGTVPSYSNTDNYFNSPTRKLLVEEKLDMNVTNPGLIDAINANNMMLGAQLFKMMNKFDRFAHPQERNFTLYSCSSSAQWLKDAFGNSVSKFNMVGNAGNEVAGITTPYELIRTTIGDLYHANYIATNRLKPIYTQVNGGATGFGKIPAGKKATLESSDWYLLPAFEDDKDTMVFVSGKEYLTEGTGTAEDPASASLNYQHRYQMLKMNKMVGKLRFTELPTSYED